MFERQVPKQTELTKEESAQVKASATELPDRMNQPAVTVDAKITQAPTKLQAAGIVKSASPEEKADSNVQPSTHKAESKPKQVGKFNVEIR